jgi:hypothetical protein
MEVFATIATAVIGLAIVGVLVSKNSQTPNVIKVGASGFASIINAAMGPAVGNGLSVGGLTQ